MEEQKKRKTHTSNAVKQRYFEKTYTRLIINVRKERAEVYKRKCEELGIPYSKPLQDAIDNFLKKGYTEDI